MAEIRKLVFWQPNISIHFSAVLRALAKRVEVVLCVIERQSLRRKAQGWPEPELDKVCVHEIFPAGPTRLFHQLNAENTLHIFSGTRGYKPVWQALRLGIQTGAHCALVGETLDWRGWKGSVRYLIARYDARYLKKHIHFVLAISHLGKKWYQQVGFPSEKIVDWAYFTESPSEKYSLSQESEVIRFVFVGRFSPEKGIRWLIDSFAKIGSNNYEVHLLGHGPLYEEIRRSIPTSIASRFKFHGNVPNHEVSKLVAGMDYLILPSTGKDGWGAVVNEAFQVGTPAIVSLYAGASTLIEHSDFGFRVDPKCPESLVNVLDTILKNLRQPSAEQRQRVKKYAQTIAGSSGADYLLEVVQYFFVNNHRMKPVAPWRKSISNSYRSNNLDSKNEQVRNER